MTIKDIITIIIAACSLLVTLWMFFKNQKLQKKNLELQREKLQYEKEKDAGEELTAKIVVYKGNLKKGSDRDIYCNHIIQKFKYLDFTGLNAILQKPFYWKRFM